MKKTLRLAAMSFVGLMALTSGIELIRILSNFISSSSNSIVSIRNLFQNMTPTANFNKLIESPLEVQESAVEALDSTREFALFSFDLISVEGHLTVVIIGVFTFFELLHWQLNGVSLVKSILRMLLEKIQNIKFI